MEAIEFLDLVWGERRSFVDVPSKAGGHWIPFNVEWPADRVLVRRRLNSCLEDDEDIYFSVAQFQSKGRRLADVLPTSWLWADLDRVDPVFLDSEYLLPTIAWESSPGRYQCLWQLTKELKPETQTKLNQRLSYALTADRGGWDLTQVLRPVGTRNFKYDPPADVELLWHDEELIYPPKEVLDAVVRIEEEEEEAAGAIRRRDQSVQTGSLAVRIPARARRLIGTPPEMVVVGERSARLWELEKLLAEAGLTEDQIFDLVWPTAWNKHREVRTGEDRLRKEIAKALAQTEVRPRSEVRVRSDRHSRGESVDQRRGTDEASVPKPPRARITSPFVDYATFLSTNIETPRWLIEGIWSSSSHGIVGGEPKVSKSTLATAMGLCVATGKPFLNRYPVANAGPVLLIQEENAPWVVQDRLRKLAHYHGLLQDEDVEISAAPKGSMVEHIVRLNFPDEAPLKLLNNYGFNLTDDEDLKLLEDEVRKIGAALVIIDPLYLVMGDTNLNNSHEVGPLLQWLMALRYNHNCAVILVHHWSKSNENTRQRRAGQRLMGSAMFHGWVESALYMEKLGNEEGIVDVRIEREFRNVAPQGDLEVVWKMGEPGELDMEVAVKDVNESERADELIESLLEGVDGRGLNVKIVAEKMGWGATTESRQAAAAIATELGYRVKRKKYPRGYGYVILPRGGRR